VLCEFEISVSVRVEIPVLT